MKAEQFLKSEMADLKKWHKDYMKRMGVPIYDEEVEAMLRAALADPECNEALRDKERLATWMIKNSYATGHGDSLPDLIRELDWQHAERRAELAEAKRDTERLRVAKVALHRIGDNDDGNGCECQHDDENCCEKVDEYCPTCIAAVALQAIDAAMSSSQPTAQEKESQP